jgi:hypothetical protein
VAGCASRISKELRKLCEQSAPKTDNSQALVVAKSKAITDKIAELGLRFGKRRTRPKYFDQSAYTAGHNAGGNATFGRPVSDAGALLRLGRR